MASHVGRISNSVGAALQKGPPPFCPRPLPLTTKTVNPINPKFLFKFVFAFSLAFHLFHHIQLLEIADVIGTAGFRGVEIRNNV